MILGIIPFFVLSAVASAETASTIATEPSNSASAPESTQTVSASHEPVFVTGSGVAGEMFLLDGSKSQDDGVVRTFLWRQVEGPLVTLSDARALKTTFTPTFGGTYVFDLTVTDATGRSATAQRSEVVIVGNDAPQTSEPAPAIYQQNETDINFVSESAPPATSIGDVNRDGAIEKTTATSPVAPATTPSAGAENAKVSPASENSGNNENWNFDGDITLRSDGGGVPPALILALFVPVLGFFWFGWREWLKRKTKPELPAEDDGTKAPCGTCGGSGEVTKKRKFSAPCKHCKETGMDICHHCGGTGRYGVGLTVPQTEDEVASLMKCDYCKGSGFKKPAISCCMCKGKRKEEAEESYKEKCPTCGGSGRTK